MPYRENISDALNELREKVFAGGRYKKPEDFTGTHASIDDALNRSGAEGMRSILDMIGVVDFPRNPEWHGLSEYQTDFGSDQDVVMARLTPLTSDQQTFLFDTDRTTSQEIKRGGRLFHFLDGGLGLYIIIFANNAPSEILFAGYSYD